MKQKPLYIGDEHNKLLTKLFDSIRALMRVNANQCQSN